MARLVKVITPNTTNRSAGEYTEGAKESAFPNPNRSPAASGSATLIFPELGLRISLKERGWLRFVVEQSLWLVPEQR